MDEDRVGEWGNGKPNGARDGHFRLTLNAPGRFVLPSISVWSANEKGERTGGQIWHTKNGKNWMLGVFRDGRQINAGHVASLGEFSGWVTLDLYANSSGWFNPGQWFLLEIETSDGQFVRQLLQLNTVGTNQGSIVVPSRGSEYTGVPIQGQGQLIFEVGNIGGTLNGPTKKTRFTLDRPHMLTLIRNYHWNSARGARPGTISLQDKDGRTWGPWQTSGTPGQGGVPNVYWTAHPNIVLPASSYTVIDSDPASWSHNGESDNRGFVRLEGYPAAQASDPGSLPSTGNAEIDNAVKEVDGLIDAIKSLKGLFGK
jgi:hypothetical protein